MSDIQDLIHKTSIDCIEKGQAMERVRIIKLLEDFQFYGMSHELNDEFCRQVIKLIKGETK